MNWALITDIYYDSSQEDANEPCIATAVSELQDYLNQISGLVWPSHDGLPAFPPHGCLVLDADGSLTGYSDETFRIITDVDYVIIYGNSAWALRHGAYDLLHRLGVRWYYPDDAWTIVPAGPLLDLGAVDEISEPYYFWRGFYCEGTDDWHRRNCLWGMRFYHCGAVYSALLNYYTGWYGMSAEQKRAYYLAHPDEFYPTDKWLASGYPTYPWQLNPTHPNVIQGGVDYAASLFNTVRNWHSQKFLYKGWTYTPNDGTGWEPPFNEDFNYYPLYVTNDYFAITNQVFNLPNQVAGLLSDTFPDCYFICLAYTLYGGIPNYSFHEKFIPVVCNGYNYTDIATVEQIEGYRAKGVIVGVYDYPYVWSWHHDSCYRRDSFIGYLQYRFAVRGTYYYNSESQGDPWGCIGLTVYVIIRLLWNPAQSIDDIKSDFCTLAFGAAAATMLQYFNPDAEGNSADAVCNRLINISDALILVAGSADIEARLYRLACYEYFVWKYHTIGYATLPLLDLEDFYTACCKMRDFYLFTFDFSGIAGVELTLRAQLKVLGLSDAEVDALQDFIPPNVAQMQAWIAEMQAALGVVYTPILIEPDPNGLRTQTLGDLVNPPIAPGMGMGTYSDEYWVYSNVAEAITIEMNTSISWKLTGYQWISPSGIVEMITVPAFGGGWTPFQVNTNGEVGVWRFLVANGQPFPVVARIQNRQAARLMVEPRVYRTMPNVPNIAYFYVPAGTPEFSISVRKLLAGATTGRYTDPVGGVTNMNYDNSAYVVYTENAPMAGLWKVELDDSSYFILKGILPLVWYDPQWMMIEDIGAPTNYNVTLEHEGKGTTIPAQDSVTGVDEDEGIVLKMVAADSKWTFNGWYDAGVLQSKQNRLYVLPKKARTITAEFSPIGQSRFAGAGGAANFGGVV